MYFWRVRNLVKLLGERELTELEAFRYYFANLLLITIAAEFPTDGWNAWDTVIAVVTVAMTVLGLLYCFHSNGGAAGREFLARFSALTWVVTLRTIAVGLPVILLIMGVADAAGVMTDESSWWEVPLVIAFDVIIALRVAAHLRTVNALRRQYGEWSARREAAPSEPVAEDGVPELRG
jgi:hypothetical protein